MTTMNTASGDFEINLTPQADEAFAAGRMLIDKTYSGDLAGKGRGQMLSVRTATQGSAGYVAIEIFEGELEGKNGTFALQHSGLMNRGTSTLEVKVIPDSGTGELEGLKGSLKIIQTEGKHAYEFSYSLESE